MREQPDLLVKAYQAMVAHYTKVGDQPQVQRCARRLAELEGRELAEGGPVPSRPTAKGYPMLAPEGCPACGGRTFRLEAGLWACDGCTPEGAEVIRDADVIWVQRSAAVDVLNERGVRIMENPAGPERLVLGVWRAMDSPELREAFKLLRLDRLPLRYLDGADIPERYKVPVPEALARARKKQGELFTA